MVTRAIIDVNMPTNSALIQFNEKRDQNHHLPSDSLPRQQ